MKAASDGLLYGLTQNNATIVLGFSLNGSIESHLPFGFKELGRIEWLNDAGDSKITQNNNVNYSLSLNFDALINLIIYQ